MDTQDNIMDSETAEVEEIEIIEDEPEISTEKADTEESEDVKPESVPESDVSVNVETEAIVEDEDDMEIDEKHVPKFMRLIEKERESLLKRQQRFGNAVASNKGDIDTRKVGLSLEELKRLKKQFEQSGSKPENMYKKRVFGAEVDTHKMAERAARFGIAYNEEDEHLDKLGVNREMWERAKKFGTDKEVIAEFWDLFGNCMETAVEKVEGEVGNKGEIIKRRVDSLFITGRAHKCKKNCPKGCLHPISTTDILSYFDEYTPAFIEWIDEGCANVVFEHDEDAQRALVELTSSMTTILPDNASEKIRNKAELWYFAAKPLTCLKSNAWGKAGTEVEFIVRWATTDDCKAERDITAVKAYANRQKRPFSSQIGFGSVEAEEPALKRKPNRKFRVVKDNQKQKQKQQQQSKNNNRSQRGRGRGNRRGGRGRGNGGKRGSIKTTSYYESRSRLDD
eukprot:TRINITY_DN779989_c0_g1_i1.p1 TRINITY_DN779989_c0_g1~~TRINITY_DN779989_c0_g1_i1.p1  ORF type:complete len:452 (-),score=175.25 TRINITY_DN779989_c0_g1_i1:181-1536(-)